MSTTAINLASTAAKGFKVFECEACAQRITQALTADGHGGQRVEIRGAGGRDFIICLSYDGGQATITQNGRHIGVRIDDMVFANLHPDGMPFDLWVKDFDAIGGIQ